MRSEVDPRERLVAFLILVCVGACYCWAREAVFKADDYPVIAYASDWGRVLHDFGASQYGLSFFVFWRPAITTSLAIDHALFGVEAWGYFAMNALAFAASVFVLWTILRALCPERPVLAWSVALLWLLHPAPVVSLHWVVGRVDTHSVLPILLCCALHLRYRRGRGRRWPVLLCMAWALASKESAIGLPLLLLGLDLLDRHPSLPGGPAISGRGAPALVYLGVLPLFFGLRYVLLGTALGGYGFLAGEALDVPAMLDGLRQSLAQALVPGFGALARDVLVAALLLGVASWALWGDKARRTERCLAVLLVSAGIWAPLAQLLPSMRDPAQQRYAYFACVWSLAAYCGLVCFGTRGVRAGAPRVVVSALLCALPAALLLPERGREVQKMRAHDAFCEQLSEAVDDAVRDGKGTSRSTLPEPLVLGGRAEAANHPQRFLWGLTHVHAPPFRSPAVDVVSLRKLAPYAAEVPTELATAGSRLWLEVASDADRVTLERAPEPSASVREPRALGFDETLDVGAWERLVDADCAIGWETQGTVSSVAVLTSVGSALMRVPPRAGELRLRELLLSNVAWRDGPEHASPLIGLILNPLDLAPASAIYLVWKDDQGVSRARFRATRGFTRRAIQELRP